MATVSFSLFPEDATFPSSNFPQLLRVVGTNFGVASLGYDTTTQETAHFCFPALNYGSGNLTLDFFWYAASGTSGGVTWGASLAAITADTDTQDVETKAFATEQTVNDTHLGTTAKRLHKCSLTLSNLDSIAVGDNCWLRIRRVPADAGDTLAADARLVEVRVSYSDT
jgi:hypothetical protein